MKRLILPSIFALAFSIVSLFSLNSQARTSISVNFGYPADYHSPVYVNSYSNHGHSRHSHCQHHSHYSKKHHGKHYGKYYEKKHWKKHHYSHNSQENSYPRRWGY